MAVNSLDSGDYWVTWSRIVTRQRRPLLRFLACSEDLSHESPDARLPEALATGAEPIFIVGTIADR